MLQRFKVANRDLSILNVISVTAAALASSMIQAMNSTKHYAKWCWSPPEAPNNWQGSTCKPHWHQTWKQEGCDLPFLSLQEVQMLPSLTQALILALRWRGTALPHDWTIAKQKTGWQNGSYNNTYRREYSFQKWGGRQTYWMLSKQRREIQSIAHSQPTRSGKEGVDYASEKVWVLMTITTWPHVTNF